MNGPLFIMFPFVENLANTVLFNPSLWGYSSPCYNTMLYFDICWQLFLLGCENSVNQAISCNIVMGVWLRTYSALSWLFFWRMTSIISNVHSGGIDQEKKLFSMLHTTILVNRICYVFHFWRSYFENLETHSFLRIIII